MSRKAFDDVAADPAEPDDVGTTSLLVVRPPLGGTVLRYAGRAQEFFSNIGAVEQPRPVETNADPVVAGEP